LGRSDREVGLRSGARHRRFHHHLLCPGLIVHLISGDTSPRGILVDGLRFFGVALTIAMVVFFVGRWLYWFADRWIQKG
jgi:hypothetical protein